MKDNINKRIDEGWQIDDLFRQGLGDLNPEPSQDLWKGINRKLWWDEISHFTFTNLSKLLLIGGIAVVMTLITALMVVVAPQPNNQDDSPLSFSSAQAGSVHGLLIPVSSLSNISKPSAEPMTASTGSNPSHLQSASENILLANVSPSENPDEGIIADHYTHAITTGIETTSLSSQEITQQERNSELLSYMKPLDNEEYLVLFPGNDPLMFTPSMIRNIKGKPPVPAFFSVDMKVSPEATFHESSSSGSAMSFSSDLGFKYHFGRFSIGSGIGIDYETSDGIYRIDYKSKDSVGFYTQVISYAINQQNPSEITYITRCVTVYDSISHIADDQTKNRYTYLQVPLLAGFRILETTRLGLTAYAGPMVTFLVGKKEAQPVIDYPNARIIRIDNNTPVRLETTWQFWLGLRLDYKITKEFSLFAEPYYKYYFQPLVEHNEGPVTNPYSLGLGIGIQYNFGRKIVAQ